MPPRITELQRFDVRIPSRWGSIFARERARERAHDHQLTPVGGGTPVRPDIHPNAPPAPRYQHVSVTGTTEFHDYETFGSDEHGTFGFRQENVLSTNDTGTTLLTWRQGFGGEERVEIDIDGSLRSDGALSANMQIRFYEGATEGTSELEDSKVFQSIVPADQISNFHIHLRNNEDDWATVRGSIGNRSI